MRRLLLGIVVVVGLAVLGPPLAFRLAPSDVPALPPPGRRVDLGGGAAVNLLETGAGPPVVLVHGLPGTAYHWRRVAEELAARGHRALAYDRPGYGRSDPRPDDDYSVNANAGDLVALLEAEGLEDATVVGHSYGGKTAMTAALLDPSRMGRLVLVNTAGRWDDPPPPSRLYDVFASAPVQEWIFSVPPVSRALGEAMRRRFFSDQPVPAWFSPVSRALFARPETRHTWREEQRRFRFDGPDPAPIALPILVLHGDDDRIAPLVIAEGIVARAPHARLVVQPGGSHVLTATHPVWVAEQIADFAAEK